MKRVRALSACLLLITGISHAAVTVTGDVANPGAVELPAGGRLLDVISVAQPNVESYWLAAVLLRKSLVEQQTRLKVGVLFDDPTVGLKQLLVAFAGLERDWGEGA